MLQVDLQKRLGDFNIDVAFKIEDRGITALFGRSGAGKTTLINMMAGLLRPDSGRLYIGGQTLFDSAAKVNVRPERRRVGYVFQEGRLFPHLSVKANLLYGRRFAPKGERYQNAAQIIDLLGLGGLLARRPATLSGGEKQRVAIGRALLSEPRLLLMDEPMAGLDATAQHSLLDLLDDLRSQATTIVLSTHDLSCVSAYCRYAACLNQKLIAFGPPSQVLNEEVLSQTFGSHLLMVHLDGQAYAYQHHNHENDPGEPSQNAGP